jgi:hypothetical protein
MGNKKKDKPTRFPGYLRKEMTKRMRHLIFGPASMMDAEGKLAPIMDYKELYEILYDTITNTPRGFEKSEARVFGRVLSKLESIGHSIERTPKTKSFDLNDDGGIVSLEDAEYSLMMDALNSVQWNAKYVRKADSLYTWLDSAPKELPELKIVPDEPASGA